MLMLSRRIMALMGWGDGFMICWGRGVILMVRFCFEMRGKGEGADEG